MGGRADGWGVRWLGGRADGRGARWLSGLPVLLGGVGRADSGGCSLYSTATVVGTDGKLAQGGHTVNGRSVGTLERVLGITGSGDIVNIIVDIGSGPSQRPRSTE